MLENTNENLRRKHIQRIWGTLQTFVVYTVISFNFIL